MPLTKKRSWACFLTSDLFALCTQLHLQEPGPWLRDALCVYFPFIVHITGLASLFPLVLACAREVEEGLCVVSTEAQRV